MADYTLRKISNELWRKVKALAAMRGESIRQMIINLLKEEIKKNGSR